MKQNYRMINVSEKKVSSRRAIATGRIKLSSQTMALIRSGTSPKGDILSIAEVAGIMAAKNAAQILPLCHPLLLDGVRVWFEVEANSVVAFCEVHCESKTGVEMEALVGVNCALLTIYDLAKAVDPVIEIQEIFLQFKEGGKSGIWHYPNSKIETAQESQTVTSSELSYAVITLSDRASQGIYEDKSGVILRDFCKSYFGSEVFYRIIADDPLALKNLILEACESRVDILLLTGGTGISQRDITPDVVAELADKELSGFGELQRQYGAHFTKASWLSRSSAYVVKETLVVLFPGSPKGVQQGLECVGSLIPHAVDMMRGKTH